MSKLYHGIRGNSIRSDSPLTDDQLRAVVPSVFMAEAHESRSSRFAPVCTADVLKDLAEEGFLPFFATQTKVRDEGKKEFTRHMLRLRQHGFSTEGEANEIIMLNANDGTSSYQIISGQFRFVCANGLVMGNIENNIRVHHKGDASGLVIDGVYEVIKDFEEIAEQQARMKSLVLTDTQRLDFAKSAYFLKNPLTMEELLSTKPLDFKYDPAALLMKKRTEDQGRDLFTTFNVVQENLIKGGQQFFEGRRSRAITDVKRDLQVNTQLWNLAASMAKDVTPVQY